MTGEFDPGQYVEAVKDTFTVRRVFGEAYQHDGVLVIPVARVVGAGGVGSGGGEGPLPRTAEHGAGHGGGGGFGVHARPAGFVVVTSSGARWHPTPDATLIALTGEVVLGAVAVTLAMRSLVRAAASGLTPWPVKTLFAGPRFLRRRG